MSVYYSIGGSGRNADTGRFDAKYFPDNRHAPPPPPLRLRAGFVAPIPIGDAPNERRRANSDRRAGGWYYTGIIQRWYTRRAINRVAVL